MLTTTLHKNRDTLGEHDIFLDNIVKELKQKFAEEKTPSLTNGAPKAPTTELKQQLSHANGLAKTHQEKGSASPSKAPTIELKSSSHKDAVTALINEALQSFPLAEKIDFLALLGNILRANVNDVKEIGSESRFGKFMIAIQQSLEFYCEQHFPRIDEKEVQKNEIINSILSLIQAIKAIRPDFIPDNSEFKGLNVSDQKALQAALKKYPPATLQNLVDNLSSHFVSEQTENIYRTLTHILRLNPRYTTQQIATLINVNLADEKAVKTALAKPGVPLAEVTDLILIDYILTLVKLIKEKNEAYRIDELDLSVAESEKNIRSRLMLMMRTPNQCKQLSETLQTALNRILTQDEKTTLAHQQEIAKKMTLIEQILQLTKKIATTDAPSDTELHAELSLQSHDELQQLLESLQKKSLVSTPVVVVAVAATHPENSPPEDLKTLVQNINDKMYEIQAGEKAILELDDKYICLSENTLNNLAIDDKENYSSSELQEKLAQLTLHYTKIYHRHEALKLRINENIAALQKQIQDLYQQIIMQEEQILRRDYPVIDPLPSEQQRKQAALTVLVEQMSARYHIEAKQSLAQAVSTTDVPPSELKTIVSELQRKHVALTGKLKQLQAKMSADQKNDGFSLQEQMPPRMSVADIAAAASSEKASNNTRLYEIAETKINARMFRDAVIEWVSKTGLTKNDSKTTPAKQTLLRTLGDISLDEPKALESLKDAAQSCQTAIQKYDKNFIIPISAFIEKVHQHRVYEYITQSMRRNLLLNGFSEEAIKDFLSDKSNAPYLKRHLAKFGTMDTKSGPTLTPNEKRRKHLMEAIEDWNNYWHLANQPSNMNNPSIRMEYKNQESELNAFTKQLLAFNLNDQHSECVKAQTFENHLELFIRIVGMTLDNSQKQANQHSRFEKQFFWHLLQYKCIVEKFIKDSSTSLESAIETFYSQLAVWRHEKPVISHQLPQHQLLSTLGLLHLTSSQKTKVGARPSPQPPPPPAPST